MIALTRLSALWMCGAVRGRSSTAVYVHQRGTGVAAFFWRCFAVEVCNNKTALSSVLLIGNEKELLFDVGTAVAVAVAAAAAAAAWRNSRALLITDHPSIPFMPHLVPGTFFGSHARPSHDFSVSCVSIIWYLFCIAYVTMNLGVCTCTQECAAFFLRPVRLYFFMCVVL